MLNHAIENDLQLVDFSVRQDDSEKQVLNRTASGSCEANESMGKRLFAEFCVPNSPGVSEKELRIVFGRLAVEFRR